MNNNNFSTTIKEIIEHKPLFNKAVKTFDKSRGIDLSTSKYYTRGKRVLFICDYEGKILSVGSPFSDIDCEFKNVLEKSVLDFIHQEDIYTVIEHLVQLLQEKEESVVFEARFLCKKRQYQYVKWHVGYICGLFFFYPINIPNREIASSQESSIKRITNPTQKIDPNTFYWKLEVEKTLFDWDQLINVELKKCINF
ncbi:MAG: PAS domain-containing protein [Flavobacteriaceae bacterium]